MADVRSYPLARDGIYRSIQGEGALLGEPMVFVRLAGCSVGCPLCDTDYRVASRATAEEIAARAAALAHGYRWAWITGGEPTDHDLGPLIAALEADGLKVALATSGVRSVESYWRLDWLSVSPHDPTRWRQEDGDEVKVVPGLNGFWFEAFREMAEDGGFAVRYVMPCHDYERSMRECLEVVRTRPGWRLGVQAHKAWGMA